MHDREIAFQESLKEAEKKDNINKKLQNWWDSHTVNLMKNPVSTFLINSILTPKPVLRYLLTKYMNTDPVMKKLTSDIHYLESSIKTLKTKVVTANKIKTGDTDYTRSKVLSKKETIVLEILENKYKRIVDNTTHIIEKGYSSKKDITYENTTSTN